MKSSNIVMVMEFVELNPRSTRRMMGEAVGLSKDQLRTTLKRMRDMVILETETINGRSVEFYTINPHYDKQRVSIKKFEPIEFTHHPLMTHFYGIPV